jgi:hypothetical protein
MLKRILCGTLLSLLFVTFSYSAGECKKLGKILGGDSSRTDNVCDVFVPRNLTSVLGSFTLQPEIGIGLETSFIAPNKKNRNYKAVDGELALLESEIQTATEFLQRHDFDIIALHNHYLFEEPRIMFLHFEKEGNAIKIAKELRQLEDLLGGFNESNTSSSSINAHAINKILKLDGTIQPGGVYRADFQRPFKIRDSGVESEPECMIAIQGTMENALLVAEIAVKVKEIQRFIKALTDNGLIFTALHNHEVSEKPRVYYIHFEQFGQSATDLARAVRKALDTIRVEKEGE